MFVTMAVLAGNPIIVKLLLNHGADQATHPGQKKPLTGIATIARRQNLPDDLIARLTCQAFDSARTAGR